MTFSFLVYILFEIAWLITGTVWVIGVDVDDCDKTIHIFSVVVIVNFWIHILTPLLFMLWLVTKNIISRKLIFFLSKSLLFSNFPIFGLLHLLEHNEGCN